LDNRW